MEKAATHSSYNPYDGYDKMITPIVVSIIFHVLVVVLLQAGVPFLSSDSDKYEDYVEIEFIGADNLSKGEDDKSASQKTPKKMTARNDSPEPLRKPSSPKIVDDLKVKDLSKPQAPELAESTVPAVPELQKEQKNTPAPGKVQKKPTPPKPKKEEEKAKPKEDAEAAQAQDFSSLLKNLAPDAPEHSTEGEIDGDRDAKGELSPAEKFSRQVSGSEMALLKSQLAGCWNIPAGAKYAEDLDVKLRIFVNPDRTVREVHILDTSRYNNDPYFRTAAESAVRAVYSPACSPLKLPVDGYEQWKTIVVNFNPKDML